MRILAALLVAIAPGIAAQQPSAAQVQQALQGQPGLADQARSRIAASGLTPDQIRSRLQAAGYPANLLDAYMTSAAGPATTGPTSQELAAIQALGIPPLAERQLLLPDTGVVRVAAGAPSDVFGVDVFRRTTTQFL